MVDRTRKWTLEDRTAAFECYFRSGSRAQVRKELGIPERTLTAWLSDERLEDEREAVREGILDAVREEAVRRGRELADATAEAILVCRKALRRDPDGKTASSLLSSLMRAREVEDRIHRLDDGGPTSISGFKLSDEDRGAFEEWVEERRAARTRSHGDWLELLRDSALSLAQRATQPGHEQLLHDLVESLAGAPAATLTQALRGDLPLLTTLAEKVELARLQAEADAELPEDERLLIGAPQPGTRAEPAGYLSPERLQ